MLTCKICVNNSMIYHICIVNVSKDYCTTGEQDYRYQIHRPGRPGKEGKEGEVKHNSENGALALIRDVIANEENKGKEMIEKAVEFF